MSLKEIIDKLKEDAECSKCWKLDTKDVITRYKPYQTVVHFRCALCNEHLFKYKNYNDD